MKVSGVGRLGGRGPVSSVHLLEGSLPSSFGSSVHWGSLSLSHPTQIQIILQAPNDKSFTSLVWFLGKPPIQLPQPLEQASNPQLYSKIKPKEFSLSFIGQIFIAPIQTMVSGWHVCRGFGAIELLSFLSILAFSEFLPTSDGLNLGSFCELKPLVRS